MNTSATGTWYNVYRCDRSELASERRDGGGVFIAVDATLHSERIFLQDSDQLEHVCVEFNVHAYKI